MSNTSKKYFHEGIPNTRKISKKTKKIIYLPVRNEKVTTTAYQKDGYRGFVPGHDMDDWL
jgi:hypothetical protein